jgi:hypothetical protein
MIIIFCRGTLEPPNVGQVVGPPIFTSLRQELGNPADLVVQGVAWAGLLSTYSEGGDPAGIADM